MAHNGISDELRGRSGIGHDTYVYCDIGRRETKEAEGLAGRFGSASGDGSNTVCCYGSRGTLLTHNPASYELFLGGADQRKRHTPMTTTHTSAYLATILIHRGYYAL